MFCMKGSIFKLPSTAQDGMKQKAVTQVTHSSNIKSRQIHWDLAGATKCKPTNQLSLSKLSTQQTSRSKSHEYIFETPFFVCSSLNVLLTPRNNPEITFDENTAHTCLTCHLWKKKFPCREENKTEDLLLLFFLTKVTLQRLAWHFLVVMISTHNVCVFRHTKSRRNNDYGILTSTEKGRETWEVKS